MVSLKLKTIENNRGRGLWAHGVTAFFDVRVTHVNSKCNQGKTTTTIFKEQEEETNRKYQQRVLDIDQNGIFHSPSFWDGSRLTD